MHNFIMLLSSNGKQIHNTKNTHTQTKEDVQTCHLRRIMNFFSRSVGNLTDFILCLACANHLCCKQPSAVSLNLEKTNPGFIIRDYMYEYEIIIN
jgi:hypothetical protein